MKLKILKSEQLKHNEMLRTGQHVERERREYFLFFHLSRVVSARLWSECPVEIPTLVGRLSLIFMKTNKATN